MDDLEKDELFLDAVCHVVATALEAIGEDACRRFSLFRALVECARRKGNNDEAGKAKASSPC